MNKAKAMLDALMGPSRDVSAKEKSQEDWKDRTVCKKFLIGFCPYDKSCLGGRRSIDPCPKIHNEHLRKAFEEHGDGKPESQFRLQCEARSDDRRRPCALPVFIATATTCVEALEQIEWWCSCCNLKCGAGGLHPVRFPTKSDSKGMRTGSLLVSARSFAPIRCCVSLTEAV
eukprot:TRINITY_DN6190_c0_g1_i2.p1 TRINITY_DN6190_c0_g1~~TRINITY_DN6190_c0_g1_i2.p1  ORF type:complete len:172 (-),score=24.29 TRINITY_DN6190_c0_g1_i2:545-1060(-)